MIGDNAQSCTPKQNYSLQRTRSAWISAAYLHAAMKLKLPPELSNIGSRAKGNHIYLH